MHALATWYRLDENFPKTFLLYIVKIIAHTMLAGQSLVSPIAFVFTNSFEARFKKNKRIKIVNALSKTLTNAPEPVFV